MLSSRICALQWTIHQKDQFTQSILRRSTIIYIIYILYMKGKSWLNVLTFIIKNIKLRSEGCYHSPTQVLCQEIGRRCRITVFRTIDGPLQNPMSYVTKIQMGVIWIFLWSIMKISFLWLLSKSNIRCSYHKANIRLTEVIC